MGRTAMERKVISKVLDMPHGGVSDVALRIGRPLISLLV